MIKIDLTEYKQYCMYFYLFDKLIKEKYSNKENYLNSIEISPSTYRRAQLNSSNISEDLINKLCSEFNLSNINNNDIEELEQYTNELYNKVYYKIDINYNDELEYIKNKISLNQITYPIYKLLELFIHTSRGLQLDTTITNYSSLYDELKKYKKMFNKDLNMIYEFLELIFSKEKDNKVKYDNIICYQILASKAYLKNNYIESLYYCNIVKEELIKTLNFSRIYSINSTIINNYIALGNYEEAYSLSVMQLNSVQANISKNRLYDFSISNYILICFIMKKYNELLKQYKNCSNLGNTLLVILVITNKILKLECDMSNYTYNKDLYNELIKADINKKYSLSFLENYNINKNILNYLKKFNS